MGARVCCEFEVSMPNNPSRRDLLRAVPVTLVTAAGAQAASAMNAAPAGEAGSITVRETSPAAHYAERPALSWRARSKSSGVIELDPSSRQQEILGFGASFTDAACTVIHRLPEAEREKLLRELFDPAEMGFLVGRVPVGASDYSASVYSYDDGDADPELKRFSIDHDRAYILPVLEAARRISPDMFLFGSPWSPPGWMKAGGTMLGGSMRKKYYAEYAQYLVRFLEAYRDAGVPVQALTVQNEVDTDQDGKMPACLWGQEYEIEFVGRHLGPAIEKRQLPVKIWVLDHNYNLWGRAIAELDDPHAGRYIDGVAWHGYMGSPEAMSKVHDAHPDKHAYWTEGGPDYTAPDYLTDWAKWSATFTGILRNHARCVVGWNLALDEHGKPNLGPFPCGGLVQIHSETREISRSGQYWAFAHFSRAVRRGARRYASTGAVEGVSHVAFANPDGGHVAVLTNTGAARTVRLVVGKREAEIALAGDAVCTLSWKG
jgi:glucosylceramidase